VVKCVDERKVGGTKEYAHVAKKVPSPLRLKQENKELLADD
jgi:hypothetical protein